MKNRMLKVVYPTIKKEACDLHIDNFNTWYFDTRVLNRICLSFSHHMVNCIIGPSGSGKSTLLRSINRINDEVEGFCQTGSILFDGDNIYDKEVDVTRLRKEIGMVFQKPCVFPVTIFENVLFGISPVKKMSKKEKYCIAEENIKAVSLWSEVSHRLHHKATSLSTGQQQRLCIARTLAVNPKVILLDEPTSSLDPVSTRAIENLIVTLKKEYTIIFVTHNISQARRIADHITFLCDGKIIEHGLKEKLFTNPEKEKTKIYLSDQFCEC